MSVIRCAGLPYYVRRWLLCAAISVGTVVTTTGCEPGFENAGGGENGGGGNGGGNGSDSTQFIGPGPMWELATDDDDGFDLNVRSRPGGDLLNDIAGRVEHFSSGFSRFNVNNVVGQGGPADNAQLPALQVGEEQLLLVQHWQNAGRLIPLVPGKECPDALVSANWIQWVTPANRRADSDDNAFFGALLADPEGEEVVVDPAFALTEDFPEQDAIDPLATGTCNAGVARDGQNHTFYGSNGTVVLHRNVGTTDEQMWLGLPMTSLSAADLDGEYIGVWLDRRQTGSDVTWYATLSCSNNGSCEVQRVTDIANLNSVANQTVQIELDDEALDEPQEGFVTGYIEEVNPSDFLTYRGQIACTASDDFNNTGDKVIACVGQSPQNNQTTVNGFFVAQE